MRFAEVAESVTERVDDPSAAGVDAYVGLDHLDSGTPKISRWGSPADVESTKLRFYPGDVIYARRRAYQRKLGVAEFEGICSAHALVLRARPDVCLPEFLPYFLQSDQFHERALDISVGSLSPTINWKTLAIQLFVLPPPEEQLRVVELMSSLFACSTSYERALKEVGTLREAVLVEASAAPSLRFQPLGEVCTVVSGESWSADSETDAGDEDATKVVGISSLKPDGSIDYSEPTYVKGLASKHNLFTVDRNCILVIRTNGNADRIGNVYIATQAIVGCALSAFIFGCRFTEHDEAELAFEFMRGHRFQQWSTSLVAGSTGLKNLPISKLRTAMVPTLDAENAIDTLQRLRAIRRTETAARRLLDDSRSLVTATRESLLARGT